MIDWLAAWYNWLFLFALAVTTVFSTLQVLLGMMPDALDVEVDVDGDGDVDIDIEIEADGDHDLAAKASFASNAMAFVGYGKAPASVLALAFLMLFGTIGLVLTALTKEVLEIPVVGTFVFSADVFIATFMGAFATGKLARVLNRFLPGFDTASEVGHAAVHREGKAASEITERGGQVQLGPDKWVDAVTAKGRPTIHKGSKVLLIGYDKELFRYTVEPL